MGDASDSLPPDPALAAVFRMFTEITILAQLSNALLNRVLPTGLTASQFALLNHFARQPEGYARSLVELARIFQVTKPSMGEVVERLATKGFLAVAANPVDRRSKIISLTPAGRQAREDGIRAVAPMSAELIERFGQPAIEAVVAALEPIRAWMDEQRDCPPPSPGDAA